MIDPYNNTETWTISAPWNDVHCNASINFNVPGKPNPPPVPLTINYYLGAGGTGQPFLYEMVFNDPSGTIAKPDMPLNTWILVDSGAL